MSKRKGVSADEKKQRMMQLFYEKKDFFQLKELEKIAPKEKGIVAQSVKEVIQGLVDDGLVDSEKIGTSIYFWAFPSKAEHAKKRKLEGLESKTVTLQNSLKKCEENISLVKIGREDNPERQEILASFNKLTKENEELINNVKLHKDNDPETFEQMKKDIQSLKDQINQHTDNIFTFMSWSKSRFGMEEDMLYKQFGIPPDIDYIN